MALPVTSGAAVEVPVLGYPNCRNQLTTNAAILQTFDARELLSLMRPKHFVIRHSFWGTVTCHPDS